MANPLFLALDTPSVEQALAWTTAVRRHIGGVKVGLELFGAAGPQGLRRIAEVGLPVFLDLKFHDIPNTVGKAVAAVAPLNPFILTVHAQGGEAMMRAARAAAPASCRVVAVTVLTSLDDADLSTLGMPDGTQPQVARLAAVARAATLDGVVCSGTEVAARRVAWPDGLFVVPGLRTEGGATADQKRTMTPARALADGAGVLVVGRPITDAPDPAAAARAIAESLALP